MIGRRANLCSIFKRQVVARPGNHLVTFYYAGTPAAPAAIGNALVKTSEMVTDPNVADGNPSEICGKYAHIQ
jgi:hypothetical protein